MNTLSLFDDEEKPERSAEQKGKRSHAEIEASYGYNLYSSLRLYRQKLAAAETKESIAHYQTMVDYYTNAQASCAMPYTPPKEQLNTAQWQNRKKR